jgi:hypothetical protein
MRFFSFLLIFFLLSVFSSSAQVNTERYRKEYNKLGFGLRNTTTFVFSSGNTDELEMSEQLRMDWNNPIQDYYAIVEYEFKRANQQKTKNKGFIHLRTIRQLNQEKIMGEAFTQLEFDQFLQLKSRFLAGIGFRTDLIQLFADTNKNNPVKFFLGIGAMYENESYTTSPPEEINHFRSTNYLSLATALSENAQLNVVTYYQPAFSDWSNFRFTSDINLSVDLLKNLALTFSIHYLHRSIPIGETVEDDVEVKTGFIIKFP